MKITRCANAGVLLEIDNVSILLDGVCAPLYPYLATPEDFKEHLKANLPDIVCFTHRHPDHYDGDFEKFYEEETGRKVIKPLNSQSVSLSGVTVEAVESRHIGKFTVAHVSFVITGSKCAWFLGDASPLDLKNFSSCPKPDVIFAPYVYANTDFSFSSLKKLGAKNIILLHMPDKNDDPYGLFQQVESVIKGDSAVTILEMEETVVLD
ncbi:MAG: MBL fold metallo-hydrolase [Clostridia bacterium]|nr:MBL fold metallo-hydrolase [Clostridia bacterium]